MKKNHKIRIQIARIKCIHIFETAYCGALLCDILMDVCYKLKPSCGTRQIKTVTFPPKPDRHTVRHTDIHTYRRTDISVYRVASLGT